MHKFVNISVNFETITPLWTGDAWMENRQIRPSSIMGSLRFWFEVISLAKGWTSPEDYENGKLKADLPEFDKQKYETLKQALIDLQNGIDDSIIEEINQILPFPAFIFGATGWKGLIRIKKIEKLREFGDYHFPLNGVKIRELKYEKEFYNKKSHRKEKKVIIPMWYFKRGFYGNFTVNFEVEKGIEASIFYPLLKFIEEYGFLGGQWNLGYGRNKINSIQKEQKIENYQQNNNYNEFFNVVNEIKQEENLKNINDNDFDIKKIGNLVQKKRYLDVIKELIIKKARLRRKISNTYKRHQIFGSTSDGTQGSKILPWITKNEDGQYEGGFISIVGLINLN